MQKSDSIAKLIPALIRAKRNFAPAVKNKRNDFFKSKYVPLDAVIDVTEGALLAEGLVVIQTTMFDGNENLLRTAIIHESGEYVQGEYRVRSVKDDPQGHGSALTYARRYTLMAILGIAPEDDDGNQASGNDPKVTFRTVKEANPQLTSGEVNAKIVAEGGVPVINEVEKAAAAEAYKKLVPLNKKKAQELKHAHGTDYAQMKKVIDFAIREELEGVAK